MIDLGKGFRGIAHFGRESSNATRKTLHLPAVFEKMAIHWAAQEAVQMNRLFFCGCWIESSMAR